MRPTSETADRPASPSRLARLASSLRGRVAEMRSGDSDAARTQRMALFTFIIRVVSAALAYFSQVFLARWMGGHEYGIFVIVWTWVVILGVAAPLGFNAAVIRLIPEYLAQDRLPLLRGLLAGSRLYGVLAATVITALGMAGIWLLRDHMANHFLIPALLAAVCLPLFTLTEVQEGIARAKDWSDLAMLPTYIWRPLMIIGFMLGASMIGLPHTAVTACTAALAATWIVALGQMLAVNRRLRTSVPQGEREWDPRGWLAIALPIFLVEGFFVLLTSSDVLMVGYFVAPEQVAVYFAASKTLALVHFVYFAVKAASAHRYSRLHHSGDRAGLAEFVQFSVKWTFWPSLACAAVLLLLGRFILSMFGEGFADGQGLLAVLMIGVLARSALGPVDALLTMAGQQKRCASAYGLAFLCNATLNLILIPRYGLMGAAVATATAMIIEAVVLFHVTRKYLGLYTFVWRPAGILPDLFPEAMTERAPSQEPRNG